MRVATRVVLVEEKVDVKYMSVNVLRKIAAKWTYWQKFECAAQWLATCAQKPKVPNSSLTASYVQR